MAASKSAPAQKGLEELSLDGLKDIYCAEKKITKTLPKMAKAAQGEEVVAAFEKHLAETEVRSSGWRKSSSCWVRQPKRRPAPQSTGSWKKAMRWPGSTTARLCA